MNDISKMSTQIVMKSFNPVEEEWEWGTSRQLRETCKIDDGYKTAVLIGSLLPTEYQLLRDICTPTKPADKTTV